MTTTFQPSSFDFEDYDKYFIFDFFQCPLFLLNYAQIFVTIFIILYLKIIYSILLIHNLLQIFPQKSSQFEINSSLISE